MKLFYKLLFIAVLLTTCHTSIFAQDVSFQKHLIDTSKSPNARFTLFADMNNDGSTDIINGGHWYKNPGTLAGPWQRFEISTDDRDGQNLLQPFLVRDFNNDSFPDIIGQVETAGVKTTASIKNNGGSTFTFYEQPRLPAFGASTGVAYDNFTATSDPGVPPYRLSFVVPTFNRKNIISIPDNPFDNQITHHVYGELYPDTANVYSVDMDNDGRKDLFTGTRWLRNTGGAFETWQEKPLPGLDGKRFDKFVIGDLNQDGRFDLIALQTFNSNPTYTVARYDQPTDLSQPWQGHILIEGNTLNYGESLAITDIDADDDNDMLVGLTQGAGGDTFADIFIQTAPGQFTASFSPWPNENHYFSLIPFDIDKDGDNDIITQSADAGYLHLYENLTISPVTPTPTPSGGITHTPSPTLSLTVTSTPTVTPTVIPSLTPTITVSPPAVPSFTPTPSILPPAGTISMCLAFVDTNNKPLADASFYVGQTVQVAGFAPSNRSPRREPAGVLPPHSYKFNTATVSYPHDIIPGVPGNESVCRSYTNLAFGSYYYTNGIYSNKWSKATFNDQFTVRVQGLEDTYVYDNGLYQNPPVSETKVNSNADGHVVLNEDRMRRTIVVVFKAK